MSNIITVAIVIDPQRFKGPLVNIFSWIGLKYCYKINWWIIRVKSAISWSTRISKGHRALPHDPMYKNPNSLIMRSILRQKDLILVKSIKICACSVLQNRKHLWTTLSLTWNTYCPIWWFPIHNPRGTIKNVFHIKQALLCTWWQV